MEQENGLYFRMKGMIFAGCSFTHGHGLWQYMDIKDNPDDDDCSSLRSIHRRYQETIRFPRLVANYFNTFEVVRENFSGDDHNSIGYINQLFNIDSNIKFFDNDPLSWFDFDDISYVVIQTSFIDRSPYITDETTLDLVQLSEMENEEYYLIKWGFSTFREYFIEHTKRWYTQYVKLTNLLESKGIKVLFLNITDDFLNLFESNKYMKNKLVKLQYDNFEFLTINDLFEHDKTLKIENDYKFFGETPPKDLHPSKKCHEVIAKSIIQKIKNEI